MEDWMENMLVDFISQHWVVFEQYCRNMGSEEMAEEIYNALGGEPD